MISRFSGEFRFLSNFYPCSVLWAGSVYPTAEHAYQASKTLKKAQRQEIARLTTPGQAKVYGQNVDLRPNWDAVKLSLMFDIIGAKFARNEELAALLLGTGTTELQEGNTWGDTYWGVCNGQGENWLGRILMIVRSELVRSHPIATVVR